MDSNVESLFPEYGKKIKQQRINLGISRSELSRKTKISVSVIDSIENGWEHILPEKTYLTPMLQKLEKELNLENNSLKTLIEYNKNKKDKFKRNYLKNISTKIFLRSEGIILYTVFLLLSILLLNRYQLILSKKNLNTITPLLYKATEIIHL